jgi:CheY-like chemotaxis protein
MASPPIRILFLDDSAVQLKLVADALTRAGYEAHSALNVNEACAAVSRCDLVLVDYNMPGITGAQALTAMSAKLTGATRPRFYLYTTDSSAAKHYRADGFDGIFVLKGDLNALVRQMEAVVRLLKTQAMRRAS